MTIKDIKYYLNRYDPMHPNFWVPDCIKKMAICIKNREVNFCNECIKCDEGDGCPKLVAALEYKENVLKK